MGVTVVGAGLAGLAASAMVKLTVPEAQVTVVEREHPRSNTALAGQFLLSRGPSRSGGGEPQSLRGFISQQYGDHEQAMDFAERALHDTAWWEELMVSGGRSAGLDLSPLSVEHDPAWFGPRLGTPGMPSTARAKEVIAWTAELASRLGVQFVRADVRCLELHPNPLLHAVSESAESRGQELLIEDEYCVLAGGNPGGSLVRSTNRHNRSSVALAYEAGLPIGGATVHMLHPFGIPGHGSAPRGFYDTGSLQGAIVSFADGAVDHETTELLAMRLAVYHLPEIVKRFHEHGGKAFLAFPDGRHAECLVTHHYSHIGVHTTDGITSPSTARVLAAGDAAVMHWTGLIERPSGAGLTRCLVDARKIAERVADFPEEELRASPRVELGGASAEPADLPHHIPELSELNTAFLPRAVVEGVRDPEIGAAWQRALANLPESIIDDALTQLSFGTARMFERRAQGSTDLVFDKEEVQQMLK